MRISRRVFLRSGLLLTTGLAADAFWIEKFFIETKEFFIGPAAKGTANMKLVQISDLHLQSVNYQLRLLTRKLNKLQPDLILITGDSIDNPDNLFLLDDFLSLIDKGIQKVAILGNWEYWSKIDLGELAGIYKAHNCSLLINQTAQYRFRGKTISVTGIDDYIGGNADYEAALKDYIPANYHIVLNHCPGYSDFIARRINKDIPVDFILSGHTHGGQVNIFGLIPYLPQGSGKYIKGWYNEGGSKLYVSKGIGTTALPVRFGARAEIAIFNL